MDLEMELEQICRYRIEPTPGLNFSAYHFVVEKVEYDLEDAADAGGHSDPQVDLIGIGIGDVFLRLCPQESLQEVVSGVDLDH